MNETSEKDPLLLATATCIEGDNDDTNIYTNDDDSEAAATVAKPIVGDEESQLKAKRILFPNKAYYQSPPQVTNEESSQSRYWGRFQYPEVTAQYQAEQSTAGDIENNHNLPTVTPLADGWDEREIRHAFIRKVYLILSAQMFVTFGIGCFMTFHLPTRNFVLSQNAAPLFWICVVSMFALICALQVYKRDYPKNMIALGAFTICTSYLVGMVTAQVAAAGGSGPILEAVFLTASVFVFLSLFTLQTKWDFSVLGAGLGMGLWILMLWGFLTLLFGFELGKVYALFGAVLFSGYIVFDTKGADSRGLLCHSETARMNQPGGKEPTSG